MKFIFLSLMIIFVASCKEVVEENIWDELSADQKALAKEKTKLECVAKNGAAFTNLENATRNLTTLFDGDLPSNVSNGDLTVTYQLYERSYDEDGEINEAEDEVISRKIIYRFKLISTTNEVLTYYVKKIETNEDDAYKTITHNLAQATSAPPAVENTVLNDYWDDLQDSICDTDGLYTLVGNVGASLVYQEAKTPTDNTTERRNYTKRYTVLNKYPVFFEHFNKIYNETTLRRSDSKTTHTREKWTITEGIENFTEVPATTCSVSDRNDYLSCLDSI